jgi:peptidoglycan-associated lipoprotein
MKMRVLSLFAAVALLAACESTPEGAGGGAGAGGAGGAAGTVKPGTQPDLIANVGDRVFFDYDKFSVKPEGEATLKKQAEWLKKYPNVVLTVEGHCDERGTREYNLGLGERRANAVKNYLVGQGVPANRIKTVSFGKERPVAIGHNDAAWAQNRRAASVAQ